VGGRATPCCIARIVAIASSAADAPIAWPWTALVELIASFRACAPKASFRMAVSVESLRRVAVPCAFT
jgi:hypothetical protein